MSPALLPRPPLGGLIGGLLIVVFGAALIIAPVATAQADGVDAEARRATRLYQAGEYEAAAAAFARARQLADEQGEPPAALDYNLGTALARQGVLDQAVETLERSVERPDAEGPANLRERSYYNLGVSEARIAEQLREQGEAQLQAENQTLQRALEAFRQSLILNPADADARHNYALVKRRLEEIEAMRSPESSPQEQGDPQQQQGEGQPQGEPQSGGSQQQSEGQGEPDSKEQPSSEAPQNGEPDAPDPSEDSSPPQEQGAGEEDSQSKDAGSGQQPASAGEEQASAGGSGKSSGPQRTSGPRNDSEAGESETQERQRGGLEATPSPTAKPTPGPKPGAQEPDQQGDGKSPQAAQAGGRGGSGADGSPEGGEAAGAGGGPEPTREQLDALRVLNALEEGSPEQFKRLFQFKGGQGRKLERDW